MNLSRKRHPTPRDSRITPRPTPAPHDGTRRCRRKNESQRQCHRARGVESSPPGDGLLDPRGRGGSTPREGFQTFEEAFPSSDLISCPMVGVQLYGKCLFFRDGTFCSPPPPRYLCIDPGILVQKTSVRRGAHRSVDRASPIADLFFAF